MQKTRNSMSVVSVDMSQSQGKFSNTYIYKVHFFRPIRLRFSTSSHTPVNRWSFSSHSAMTGQLLDFLASRFSWDFRSFVSDFLRIFFPRKVRSTPTSPRQAWHHRSVDRRRQVNIPLSRPGTWVILGRWSHSPLPKTNGKFWKPATSVFHSHGQMTNSPFLKAFLNIWFVVRRSVEKPTQGASRNNSEDLHRAFPAVRRLHKKHHEQIQVQKLTLDINFPKDQNITFT